MAATGTQTQGDLRESNPLDFRRAMPELFGGVAGRPLRVVRM